MRKLNFASLRLCVSFFSIMLFLSCASAPGVLIPRGEELVSVLPAGGRLYLWADAVQARPLLEAFSFAALDGMNAAQIMDSTKAAAAAVFPPGQGRSFYLAAAGNFPSSRANISLRASSDWEMQSSNNGNSYWYSEKDRIALALGPRAALVSDADPFDFSQRETPPPGFIEFQRGLAMAGWLPGPMGTVNNFLQGLGLPMQIPAEEFFFGAGRLPSLPSSAGFWELVLRIKTPSEAQARSLLTLFNMARLFAPQGSAPTESADEISSLDLAALLFANSPEQDGEFLTLRTEPLSERGIALLLGMFSLYSR
ncbi:MAG: hypothetical protein FWH19_01250 [Treponema sp.]|nr:hypothetical protein [Treponema sp.]